MLHDELHQQLKQTYVTSTRTSYWDLDAKEMSRKKSRYFSGKTALNRQLWEAMCVISNSSL